MDLTRITVILVLLAATTCRAQLVIKTSKREESMARLTEALANVVTSCHKGRTNAVALAGNLPSALYKALSAEHSIPIVLIQGVYKYGDRNKPPIATKKFRRPLNVFILEAATMMDLWHLIQSNIHHSIYLNCMAKVFIVDLSRNCKNLDDFLWTGWTLEHIHTEVFCRQHTNGRIIFGFNPYTGYAPVSWRTEYGRTYENSLFTVISREYVKNETVNCDDMHFDKTLDLGRHPVRILGHPDDYSQKTNRTQRRGLYAYETTRRRVLGTLFRKLNAKVDFVVGLEWLGEFIIAEPRALQYSLGELVAFTYPHKQVAANIITQFRGHKSQLNKILSIVDANSLYGMGVVYLITLIFLKIFVGQAVIPAVLNLIRLTCNTGIVNLPNNNMSRIYMGSLLFFVVTMQGIFQGDLAARLTKYMPLRNVESIKDLEDLGYTTICGNKYFKTAFEGSEIKKKFIENENERDCLMGVTKDLSSAYIGRTESFIIDLVEEHNLHISNKPVEMIYVGFEIYRNWILEERTNKMISRLVEANALEVWEIKCKPVELSDFYDDPAVKSNVDFKKLELHELTFAFVILGIGLTSATIVLVIELAIGYKYTCAITIWKSGNTWEERVVEVCN